MCYAVARLRRKLCRFAIATDGTDDTLCSLFRHGRHSTAMCCVSSCVCAVALTCGMRLLRGLGQRPSALARGGPRHRLPGPRGCLSRRPTPPRAGTRPVWPSALVHVKQPASMSHNDYLIDYALKAAQGRYSSSTDATNAGELTAAGWPGHGLRKPIQRFWKRPCGVQTPILP